MYEHLTSDINKRIAKQVDNIAEELVEEFGNLQDLTFDFSINDAIHLVSSLNIERGNNKQLQNRIDVLIRNWPKNEEYSA